MKNKNKTKIFISKLLRFLRITKEIELSTYEKRLIKLFKYHYKDKYPSKGYTTETLKPLFKEIYEWCPDEYYNDYLNCTFLKLLELHKKISVDTYSYDRELREVFEASFSKKWNDSQELPIERAIGALSGVICNNIVFVNGVQRYSLDIKE